MNAHDRRFCFSELLGPSTASRHGFNKAGSRRGDAVLVVSRAIAIRPVRIKSLIPNGLSMLIMRLDFVDITGNFNRVSERRRVDDLGAKD